MSVVTAQTCDYTGNGGYLEDVPQFQGTGGDPDSLSLPDEKKAGYVPLVSNIRPADRGPLTFFLFREMTPNAVRPKSIRDGKSNTIALWESAGTEYYRREQGELFTDSWNNRYQGANAMICIRENPPIFMLPQSTQTDRAHGYFAAWAGYNRFRARTWSNDGLTWGSNFKNPDEFHRFVNVTNDYRSPFSFHPSICMAAFGDGSVRAIDQNVDPRVFSAQLTRRGHD